MDLVLWTPRPLLPLMCRAGVFGKKGDPEKSYGELFTLTIDFAERMAGRGR